MFQCYSSVCPTLSSCCVHRSVLYVYVSIAALQHHFPRFHIHVLIFDICFSLSDVLHSVYQALGSSTLVQLTQIHSLLHLSNIPLCVCVCVCIHIPQCLYPFICWWASRLLPSPGYCKQCCNEHQGTCVKISYILTEVTAIIFTQGKFSLRKFFKMSRAQVCIHFWLLKQGEKHSYVGLTAAKIQLCLQVTVTSFKQKPGIQKWTALAMKVWA